MSGQASKRRPYIRPMQGWWRRNPFFMRYMAREVTAIIVVIYALLLGWGVVRLAQGEAAYEAWRATLGMPLMLLFHAVALAVFLYHTWSWFAIMPKTMPMIFIGGKKLAASTIAGLGLATAVAATVALFLVVEWIRP
jgi:fumarate reductase subunit C